MQVCGVICEYNPFHKGHALHLQQARERSSADYIVCVMSGAFIQRGIPARHDKWTRARMALSCGADLVLELPARFACAPAPEFAAGGVRTLAGLGVVTHLSFGCEEESLPYIETAARMLSEETPEFSAALRDFLGRGLSYPQARALAAEACSGLEGFSEAMSRPNAALAIEYMRTLPENMKPVPVVREGSGYHDALLSELSSATAVRAALEDGAMDAALTAVPCPQLLREAEARGDIHTPEALTQALLYQLRTMTPEQLRQIDGMDEGLEYRFIAAARSASSREELIAAVKSRRYTHARLSRLCARILLGVIRQTDSMPILPSYARVLGFRREATPLLHQIKKSGSLPLITKAADYDRSDPLFALDVRAQDLWSLGCASTSLRRAGRDFTTGPVIL